MLAISSLCALSVGLGFGVLSSALADLKDGFTEVTYDGAYSLGESVEIDERFYVSGGREIACESIVSLPDGSHFQGETLEISDSGRYTVTYTANVGNRVYTDAIFFNGLGGIAVIRT